MEPTPPTGRPLRMIARLIVLAFVLAGCDLLGDAGGGALDGTEWLSLAVTEDGEDRPLVDGTQIHLRFTDGQLGASAGCNSMNGAYRLEEGRLIVESGGVTEMGCDEQQHAQDEWLFGFIGAMPSVAQEGDKLTLTSGATVITLQDREIAEPDLPLTGTTWTVDSIISGEAASSVPNGATATRVFTDDGRLEFDNGCNTGGGTYEAADGTLRIGELMTTLRGCEGPAVQLETAMMGVLNSAAIEYTIDAGSLTLIAGDQGLGLRGN